MKSAYFRGLTYERECIQIEKAKLLHKLKRLDAVDHLLEMGQVQVAGSCQLCQNAHYPPCKED
jgi:hypothetical protein